MLAPSLRKRFFLVAGVTVVSLIILSAVSKMYLSTSGDQRLSTSRERLRAASEIQEILTAVSSSNNALNLYLVSPNSQYKKAFEQSFIKINKILESLNTNLWIKATGKIKHNININNALTRINATVISLFKIRTDVYRMYPGLSIANKTQLNTNRNFINLINDVLLDLNEDGRENTKIYTSFISLRDIWRRLVLLNRIYMLNLTVRLSESAIEIQEENIEIYIRQIKSAITKIKALENKNDSSFQVDEARKQLGPILEQWEKGFNLVRNFAASGEWRADVPIVLNMINPNYLKIYSELEILQQEINATADNDLAAQKNSFDTVSVLMWFLIASFMAALFLIYYLVNISLINPIIRLADKIKKKDHNEWVLEDEYIRSSEMGEFVNAFYDMQSQINERQNQLEYMALHDDLTKLPNRTLVIDRINQCIKSSKRYEKKFILILLDLDRFKEVNDTLGHLVGDDVLCQVADRLSHCLRKTDSVARLGGDEFAILLTDIDSFSLEELVQKFIDALDNVFQVKEHNLYIGSSLGVAVYPEHGMSPDVLLKHADVAMYVAKNANLDFSVYNHKEDVYNVKKLELLSEIKHALDGDQLYLKYQPIYSQPDEKIIGFECLLRWLHPVYGEIMPDDFIPNAEQTGLIKRITERVIKQALKSIVTLRKHLKNIYISVNVTAWDLQDENIISIIKNELFCNKLPPDVLLLELTERSMMNDSFRVQSTLKILSKLGIRFAIDDFGTGFSSMSYLKQLPISTLKVDKSFVFGMLKNMDDKLIVHSIIGLAHNLGLTVIAEGVEDKETLTILETLECDAIQGYYYSEPLELDEIIEKFLNSNIHYLKVT